MPNKKLIITLVCLISALGGGAYFFYPSKQNTDFESSLNEKSQLNNLKTDLTEGLKTSVVDKVSNYVINRAEGLWTKDPFSDAPPPSENPAEKKSEGQLDQGEPGQLEKPVIVHPVFIYSGYMEIENRKIAFINGSEYEVNEEIDTGLDKGYYVETIEPNWVTIKHKDPNRTPKPLTVFFGNP